MKKRIIFLIFIISYSSFSQNKILTDTLIKPGIYLTVDDIVKNQPVEFENLNIVKDSVEYGTIGNMKFMEAYKLDISKEQAKKVGGILGFCDGTNIYLTPFPPSYSNGASFHKTERIGHFLYFDGIKEVNMSQQNLFWLTNCQNVVDLKKSLLINNITNGKIKKIISNNSELLKRFKKEKKKYMQYKKYLKEYCEE